jgi:hypothetical protein
MTPQLLPFLHGVCAATAFAVGLSFYRFWRDTTDRLFGFFGTAFVLFAVSWTMLALIPAGHESRPYIYLVRLVAFLLIIAAIVDKNRALRR